MIVHFIRRGIWAICAVFCLATLGIATKMPVLGASLCPSCYGLRAIGQNIYSDTASVVIQKDLGLARKMVAAVWGDLQATPRILICQTNQCQTRLGGGHALGMSYGEWAIHIGPNGANATIIAHELAHAELFHRVGMLSMAQGQVPAWLNEGLAVITSQDIRYLHRDCRLFSHIVLPNTAKEWRRKAAQDHDRLYTAAACQAKGWLAENGGLSTFTRNF
jgi:hypothetical protein